MKVLMRELGAGPNGYMREGESHDVTPELGRQLIAGRHAVAADAASHVHYERLQAEHEAAGGDPEAPEANGDGGETTEAPARRKRV